MARNDRICFLMVRPYKAYRNTTTNTGAGRPRLSGVYCHPPGGDPVGWHMHVLHMPCQPRHNSHKFHIALFSLGFFMVPFGGMAQTLFNHANCRKFYHTYHAKLATIHAKLATPRFIGFALLARGRRGKRGGNGRGQNLFTDRI